MKRSFFSMGLFLSLMGCGFGMKTQNEPAKIPFKIIGHDIVVTAKIDGFENDFNLVVDTGGVALIDKKIADELELKQRGSMAKINVLNLSGYQIENVFCFTTFDFSLFKRMGIPIHGIIGSNLMERFKVTFDYLTNSLILSSDTSALIPRGDGIHFRFRNHPVNNAPIIQLKINGKEIEGMIDTGQPYPIALPFKDFERFVKPSGTEAVRSKGLMIKWPQTDPRFNYLTCLKSLKLGNLRIAQAFCIAGELPPMLSMPLIGTDLLSQFKMIINYPRDELMLIPNPDIQLESNLYTLGLNLNLSEKGEVFVEGIWEGSPADKAGIQAGDVVTAFNEKRTAAENLSELLKMMDDDRVESINLEISNQNGTRKLELNKEWLFRHHPGSDSNVTDLF